MNPVFDPQHAVYVGSFDPMSLGHEDIIRRAAALFPRLTVGIGINPEKRPLFSPEERLKMAREVAAPLANVRVECFEGLTVDFVREQQAKVLVRGIRTLSDIEHEFTMTLANRALEPEIETVFLMASDRFTHISSSLIKQVAQLAKDHEVDQLRQFVPEPVVAPLLQHVRRRA